MSSDPRDLIPAPDTSGEMAAQRNNAPAPAGGINIYRPKPSPLPNNRPVADNNTENMDDMLSYLD